MHGYDVIDHSRINPELGGEAGFRELAAALQSARYRPDRRYRPQSYGGRKSRQPLVARPSAVRPNERASPTTFDIDWDAPGF